MDNYNLHAVLELAGYAGADIETVGDIKDFLYRYEVTDALGSDGKAYLVTLDYNGEQEWIYFVEDADGSEASGDWDKAVELFDFMQEDY